MIHFVDTLESTYSRMRRAVELRSPFEKEPMKRYACEDFTRNLGDEAREFCDRYADPERCFNLSELTREAVVRLQQGIRYVLDQYGVDNIDTSNVVIAEPKPRTQDPMYGPRELIRALGEAAVVMTAGRGSVKTKTKQDTVTNLLEVLKHLETVSVAAATPDEDDPQSEQCLEPSE